MNMNSKWFQFAFALLGVFLLVKLGGKFYYTPREIHTFDYVRILIYLLITVTSFMRFNQINKEEQNRQD
jgi:hypothetical protein